MNNIRLIRKDTCASYEPAINETLQYEFGLNRMTVRTIENHDEDECEGCVFCNHCGNSELCDSLRCSYRTRSDNKNVIFKIVF